MKARLPDGQDYELKTNLYAAIRKDQCSYQVTRSKVGSLEKLLRFNFQKYLSSGLVNYYFS